MLMFLMPSLTVGRRCFSIYPKDRFLTMWIVIIFIYMLANCHWFFKISGREKMRDFVLATFMSLRNYVGKVITTSVTYSLVLQVITIGESVAVVWSLGLPCYIQSGQSIHVWLLVGGKTYSTRIYFDAKLYQPDCIRGHGFPLLPKILEKEPWFKKKLWFKKPC